MAEPTTTQPATGTTTRPTTGTGGTGTQVGADKADFVPIGVWVLNWADIFPWLATGYCHAIDDTSEAETMIKVRMMAQDFVTLSRLYRYAGNLKMVIPEEPAFANENDLLYDQIANSFANAYGNLAAAKPKGPAGYKQAAADAHNNSLGPQAKKIYEIWDKTPCLRSAELGLGYMKGDQSLTARGQMSIGSGGYTQWVPLEQFSFYHFGQCTFAGSNFSAFADSYKLLPLILPTSGSIIAFGDGGFLGNGTMQYWDVFTTIKVGGPNLMGGNIVCMKSGQREFDAGGVHAGAIQFRISADTHPIEFSLQGNYLENAYHQIKLYPIPFSAAVGVPRWKGQSFSTNVKADADLNEKLAKIVEDLQDPNNNLWSWSSDPLPSNWNGGATYRREALRKNLQYFGLSKKASQIQL